MVCPKCGSPTSGDDKTCSNCGADLDKKVGGLDVKSEGLRRMTQELKAVSGTPQKFPTGERIAYQAWIDGRWQIATVNPDGTDRRILTSEGTNEEPSWAPDGRHLVFRSTRKPPAAGGQPDGPDARVVVLAAGRRVRGRRARRRGAPAVTSPGAAVGRRGSPP